MARVVLSPQFPAVVQLAGVAHVAAGAQVYMEEVRRLMVTSPATGRVYQRGGRLHHASALIASIGMRIDPSAPDAFVGSRLPVTYARALEYGTDRIAPRPAWRPALVSLPHLFAAAEAPK